MPLFKLGQWVRKKHGGTVTCCDAMINDGGSVDLVTRALPKWRVPHQNKGVTNHAGPLNEPRRHRLISPFKVLASGVSASLDVKMGWTTYGRLKGSTNYSLINKPHILLSYICCLFLQICCKKQFIMQKKYLQLHHTLLSITARHQLLVVPELIFKCQRMCTVA